MSARPNVLIVMTDQQRLDSLGCYGNSFVRTPNIDAFAREAVRFDQCCTPYPVCTPARASLWTGLMPHAHGLVDNVYGVDDMFEGNPRVSDTVFDWFKAAGYRTAYFGKWHLGEKAPAWADLWDGFNSMGGHWIDGRQGFQGGRYRPEVQTDNCIAFLERAAEDDRPFIAVQSYYPPHDPYSAPPEFYAPYRAGGVPFPAYYAAVSALDHETGRLLETLGRTGLDTSTIVVYLSDHGETFGFRADSYHKFVCFEEAVRVPFLIRLPEGTGAGLHVDANIGLEDLAPTLMDLVGLAAPRPMHGRSLAPWLRGERPDWRGANYIENRTRINRHVQRCVRTRGWKLILSADGPSSLYDLSTDPEELYDLFEVPRADPHDQFRHFAPQGERKAELAHLLRDCATETGDDFGVALADGLLTELASAGTA